MAMSGFLPGAVSRTAISGTAAEDDEAPSSVRYYDWLVTPLPELTVRPAPA
jgi:hypothetical protein